jgi:hypothetical protein
MVPVEGQMEAPKTVGTEMAGTKRKRRMGWRSLRTISRALFSTFYMFYLKTMKLLIGSTYLKLFWTSFKYIITRSQDS